jgi:hypothetical protein
MTAIALIGFVCIVALAFVSGRVIARAFNL